MFELWMMAVDEYKATRKRRWQIASYLIIGLQGIVIAIMSAAIGLVTLALGLMGQAGGDFPFLVGLTLRYGLATVTGR